MSVTTHINNVYREGGYCAAHFRIRTRVCNRSHWCHMMFAAILFPVPTQLKLTITCGITYINCYKFIQLSNGCVVITSTACYLPAKPNEIIHLPGATSVIWKHFGFLQLMVINLNLLSGFQYLFSPINRQFHWTITFSCYYHDTITIVTISKTINRDVLVALFPSTNLYCYSCCIYIVIWSTIKVLIMLHAL